MGRGGPPAPELARDAARRSPSCSRSRARAATRPPTTSRSRCSRACRRSAAAAPAAASPGGVFVSNVAEGARLAARAGARRRRLRRQRRRDPAGRGRPARPRRRARARPRRALQRLPAADLRPRRLGRLRARGRDPGDAPAARRSAPLPGPRRGLHAPGRPTSPHLEAEVVHVSTYLGDRDALRARAARGSTPTPT